MARCGTSSVVCLGACMLRLRSTQDRLWLVLGRQDMRLALLRAVLAAYMQGLRGNRLEPRV